MTKLEDAMKQRMDNWKDEPLNRATMNKRTMKSKYMIGADKGFHAFIEKLEKKVETYQPDVNI